MHRDDSNYRPTDYGYGRVNNISNGYSHTAGILETYSALDDPYLQDYYRKKFGVVYPRPPSNVRENWHETFMLSNYSRLD